MCTQHHRSGFKTPSQDLSHPNDFVEILQYRAISQADRLAFTLLINSELKEINITYGILDQKARIIAAELQKRSLDGERALLLFPFGLEFIFCFLACFYAKVIAVPAYPPKYKKRSSRLRLLIEDTQAKILLTNSKIIKQLKEQFKQNTEFKGMEYLVTDLLESSQESSYNEINIKGSELAFLQYTSGSTGSPKGVMVSHSNLINNAKLIKAGFKNSENTVAFGWLPLYHDMGLIGNVLQPIYLGCRCILMPPTFFIQKPLRWLQAITKYRITTSGGPNFAYDLCVKKIHEKELPSLNLRTWNTAFNGSEPIYAETLERFYQKFSICGFRKEAFYPCYGMAETTLFVCGSEKESPPLVKKIKKETQDGGFISKVVSCGKAFGDLKIIIVDTHSLTQCVDGEIGEIWVSGDNVAKGYWGNSKETDLTFNGYISHTNEGPFLRTGDLGFLENGQLYVTGRLKDLIIIRGINHYPQDIESTIENIHVSLRSNSCAAFSIIENEEEKLIVASEVERKYIRHIDMVDLAKLIREKVLQIHSLEIHTILFLKPGGMPKTTSGKIRRHACRKRFLNGTLKTIGISPLINFDIEFRNHRESRGISNLSTDPDKRQHQIEKYIIDQISSVSKMSTSSLDIKRSINEFGFNSLMLAEIKSNIEIDIGFELPLDLFFEGANITDLAKQINHYQGMSHNKKEELLSRSLPDKAWVEGEI